jgi:hypothetical protein
MDQSVTDTTPLLDAGSLLAALFGEEKKPSVRWLRYQMKRRTIPYMKIGRLVRFDLAQVRQAIARRCAVNAKESGKAAS